MTAVPSPLYPFSALATALLLFAGSTAAVAATPSAHAPYPRIGAGANASVGGYFLSNGPTGLAKLAALAANPSQLPISRLYLGFVNPTMSYLPGSHSLNMTGLNLTGGVPGPDGDYGFSKVKSAVAAIRKGGVEVVLSLGGWDFNCFPYAYLRYSVAGYGTSTPNYYKVVENCGGSVDNGDAQNEWCYTCEPAFENETLGDFAMFPEPTWSASWQAATKYVEQGADPSAPPQWDAGIVPGQPWTDPKTGLTVTVPGLPTYAKLRRDPYADFVQLALELGVDGVDIDYEEMWIADMKKTGPDGGPWQNTQAVYKLAAIYRDVQTAIVKAAPHLFMTTAAGAVGAWSGNWWGGNLKGVWLQIADAYPDVASQILHNAMTYDLSDNEEYQECPDPSHCTLNEQVNFYMNTFTQLPAGIVSGVGYEIGTPAYPDPTHDPGHDLPLVQSELSLILQNTQSSFSHAFFWEIFKQPVAGSGQVTPTQLAQQLCKAVLGASVPRCSGTLPTY